jgi:hypothetical protein
MSKKKVAAPKAGKAKPLVEGAPKGALPRTKKPTPEWVKRKADRAEAMAAGRDPDALDEPKTEAGTKTAKVKGKKARKAGPSPDEIAEDYLRAREEAYKPKLGRPSKYKPEYAAVARALCKRGATDFELAMEFDVDVTTIWRWKTTIDDFCEALKVHKDYYDDQAERALAMRAVGYTQHVEKVFCAQGRITRAKVIEHIPPDVGAIKLWLTNRRPDKWRDKVATELTGKDGGAIEFVDSPRDRILTRIEEMAKKRQPAG